MHEIYVKIEGIHCDNCREHIKKELLKLKNVKKVELKTDVAKIISSKELSKQLIINTINKLDYFTKEEYITDKPKGNSWVELILILFGLLSIFYLINKLFGYNIFNSIPTIDRNLSYGMLFITGLLTSIHCVSMCGAIVFASSINNIETTGFNRFKKPILYNLGRLISYSLLGGIVGLVGSIINVNETITGVIIIVAAIVMFLMSLNMLNLVNFHLPKMFNVKVKNSNSFIVGLLNGLMPCGPLQAMQIYALSTGSFFRGMYSMFLFCLGTIPLMFCVGFILNVVKGKTKILLNKIASVLILILSIGMLFRGVNSLGIVIGSTNNYRDYTASVIYDNYQEVGIDLDYANYDDIIVQKNVPVRLVINADKGHLIGCNNEIKIKEYGIIQKLEVGENVIEFTPTEEGVYTFNCWMNMITNKIKVIDDVDYFERG